MDSNRGQFSALWLPDKPAETVVSAPSVIASIGSLRDRLEVGYNHPAAIPGCLGLWDFTDKSTTLAHDRSDLGNNLTKGNVADPTTAPVLSQVAGGTLPARTYFVKYTYTNANGETLSSPQSSLAISLNFLIKVTGPGSQSGATGWNVYMSEVSGSETKQNATPIGVDTDFTEPVTGLIAGDGLPGANTATIPANYIDTPMGVAWQSDGLADLFSITDASQTGLDFGTGDFTAEVILRTTDTDGMIALKRNGTTEGWTFEIIANVIAGRIADGVDFFDYTGVAAINDGLYKHLAIQWRGSTDEIVVWVNGLIDLEDSGANIDSVSTAGPFKLAQNEPIGNPKWLAADYVAVRLCNRIVDPSEFMHHWYLKSLVNGNHGGSSVLFDPQISTFPKRKSHLITVNWKREPKLEWANLMVNNKKSSPTAVLTPSVDMTELYVGGLPIVDEDTVGYWVFDGTKASDAVGNKGLVKDWSGNDYHLTVNGLVDSDLVNTKYGRYYKFAGDTTDFLESSALSSFSDLFPDEKITIESLFYVDSSASLRWVAGWRDDADTDFFILPLSPGIIEMRCRKDLGFTDVSGDPGGINRWVYAAMVLNGDDLKGYLQGVEVNSGTRTGDFSASNSFMIGRNPISSIYPFSGWITFVRVSKINRTQDEIVNNMMNFYRRANGIVQDLWST